MRSSMTLRARASRPTSVCWSAPGTRWSRLPAAMESAVRSTSSSGRRPRRTSHQPPRSASTSAAAVTANSVRKQGVQGAVLVGERDASTSTPPLWIFSARTRKEGPPAVIDEAVKYATSVPLGWVVNPVIGDGSWGL